MLARIFTKISKFPSPITPLAHSSRLPSFSFSSFPSSLAPKSLRYFSSKKEQHPVSPPDIIHTDKEFIEVLDKVDVKTQRSNLDPNSTQPLSVRLLKATTSSEILTLYEEEFENNPDIKMEDLCLVLYLACYNKADVTGDHRFTHLIENIFSKIDQINPLYLFTLLHALGIFCFDFGFVLPSAEQEKLGKLILKNLDRFELNQISATSWSAAQVISAAENKDMQTKVVSALGGILLKNSVSLTGLDYANILSTFSHCGIKSDPTVEGLLKSLQSQVEDLEREDPNTLTRLVMALGELQLKEKKLLIDIFEKVIRPNIHNMSVDDVATLILIYANEIPERLNYFRELIKNVHANYHEMTINSYMNIWLALARYKIMASDLEKTLAILKQIPFMNSLWKLRDLEGFELVNIIVVMSTIRINDLKFLYAIRETLESHLTGLENSDLVNLARAFMLYVKQDEDFYLKIHNECCDRLNHLSSEDKKLLKETFTKARAYLPSASPFVDVSLY